MHTKEYLFHIRVTYAVLLLLLITIVSCSDNSVTGPPQTQTRKENEARRKLGVRLIDPSWVFYRAEFGLQDWKYSTNGYIAKRVQRDPHGNIVSEEDHYYTGKTFSNREGTIWEALVLSFDYKTATLNVRYVGEDQRVIEAVAQLDNSKGKNEEKVAVAESILGGWGLSRL